MNEDAKRDALRRQMLSHGQRFDFVQAVRLIHHFARTKAGGGWVPEGEVEPVPEGFLVQGLEGADGRDGRCLQAGAAFDI